MGMMSVSLHEADYGGRRPQGLHKRHTKAGDYVPALQNEACLASIAGQPQMSLSMEVAMAQLVVRNLKDDVKRRLKARAQRPGRSTGEEVREILRHAVMSYGQPVAPLGQRLRQLFEGIGLEENIPELRGQAARQADDLRSA